MDVALNLATHHTDGILTITVTGELDIATTQQLLACLDSVFAQLSHHRSEHNGDQGVNRLAIDTSNVSFIDAHGLGVLIALHGRARRHHIPLHLTAPSPAVDRLLAITGTHHHFAPLPAQP
ncbi:STAS domain-containing protein [Actinomadura fulvescens]|uniref:Anti-sigma factor antagonist n=1 Tax=Actinomadura fulvescens TaxID=46160 RepID=A0ABN3Q3H5_9ACTN